MAADRQNIERRKRMTTVQIGTIKADHVNVVVRGNLIYIHQDGDTIILANVDSLRNLISKLQLAEKLIVDTKKEG